jgi:hypothetical protein
MPTERSTLEQLVKRCIPLPEKLYKRTRRRTLRTIDEVEEYFPSFKALLTLLNKRSQLRSIAIPL